MDVLGYMAVIGGTMRGMLNDPLTWTYIGVFAAAAFQTNSRGLLVVIAAGFSVFHLASITTGTIAPRPLTGWLVFMIAGSYATYGLLIFALSRLVRLFTPVRSTSDS